MQESFAAWLKRRRKSLDLTRDELARRALCSVSTIRRLEAGDLRPSRQLAESLATALEVPSEQCQAFTRFARGNRIDSDALIQPSPGVPLPGFHQASVTNLPAPLTSFVGREDETGAICDLLCQPGVRLLTLTGAPGAGKTRISLAAADRLVGAKTFPDGVWFVTLALIRDPALVTLAIATTLGVSGSPRAAQGQPPFLPALKDFLRSKKLLLVLDNFEQVISAAPLVTELLGAAAGVKALVTSREVLHVYGEHEFPLPPLPLPDIHHLPTSQAVSYLSAYASIRLFTERARAAQADFCLTAENAADVARICAWLDGLPLAIEMAAAQVRWHPVTQVFEQLQNRLAALTGGPRDLSPRQQSLQEAIEWSYDLLSAPEKRLFNWLGVFAGGFDEEAAQDLLTETGQETGLALTVQLQTLAQKSLLRFVPAEAPRYDLLETLRDYALVQLKACGEEEHARLAHAEIYYRLAQTARPVLTSGGDQQVWVKKLELEHHNLRAALSWATESSTRAEFALRLADALYPFWFTRGYLGEGRCWLDTALGLNNTPSEIRSQVLNQAGSLARLQGDLAQAQSYHTEALRIQELIQDDAGICRSLENLAILSGMQGNYAYAGDLLEQALAVRRRLADPAAMLAPLNNLAIVRQRLGDFAAVQGLYSEVIQICRATGNSKALGHALYGQAQVCLAQEDYPAALALYQESLAIRHHIGDRTALPVVLGAVGITLYYLGDAVRSAHLISAGEKLKKEIGLATGPSNQEEMYENLALVRTALGEPAFEQAWAEGQKLSFDEAVAMALSVTRK